MEQLAPTDAQEQLASRLTAEQAQKDAERVDAWVGKEGESSQESVSSMMDYLDQRPTQETATPAPTGLEQIVPANAEAAYTPESQMDKDLAYLTEEFCKVESMPDVMAALDLLSDYCDKYALDRSVEKQLRAQLMQDRSNPVAPVAVEGVTAEVPAEEVTGDAPTPVVEPSAESAEPQDMVEPVAEVPAEPEKKDSIDTDVSHFKVQYDDPETKAVVNGTMVGINRLNGKYVIKLDDGRSLELMTEDFVTMAEEDPSVVPQEAPEAIPQEAGAEVDATEAPVQAEGQPEAVATQPEASADEPEKAKASATVLAIKGLYNKAKENWDQIPAAKKRFLLATGALAVTAVGMYVAFKTGDNSVLATTGLEPTSVAPVAEVPVAESVPVLLSPDAAGPDVAASALNAQQQAIVEAAQTSEFPWNAMAEVLGRDVASSELLEAVDRASAAGVNIVEHGARNSTNWWIEVNGTANTQRVIETLAPYIK